MEKYFKAKVIKIENGTTHEGNIRDQYVTLELENGQKISIFDHSLHVEKKMLNKKILAEASILSKNPKINLLKKKEITQTKNTLAKISGQIIAVSKKRCDWLDYNYYEYLIDAGYAKFTICPKKLLKFKINEYITSGETENELQLNEAKID